MLTGVQGFFAPNPWSWFGERTPLGAAYAGHYSTGPLEHTLEKLIDLDRLNANAPRLTVGAAHVQSGEMRYFDSREERLDLRHVMASGALPPAFPAVRIDGELYWDGGILSNTPVEAVFDDNPRRNALVFAVHVWAPHGPEPASLRAVAARQKDLQYASRAASHILLAGYGCLTQMHVVRLLAEPLEGDDHFKDIDFSPDGIRQRWDAGYLDTSRVLAAHPWSRPCDPLEGFLLHEARAGQMMPDAPPLEEEIAR